MNDKKIIAYNSKGLIIYDIIHGIDDYIIAGWSGGPSSRKYKLYYNNKGGYFNYKGRRQHLNEFLRTDI